MICEAATKLIILRLYTKASPIIISIFTGPKVRFPLCHAYQNMSFPTHVWHRIGQSFCKINEMCRKFCPTLHISHMHEIWGFI